MNPRLCYAVIPNPCTNGSVGLGIVVEDEPGYSPDPRYSFESEQEAKRMMEILNQKLGLNKEQSLMIVTSSIRAQNIFRRKRRKRKE